MASYLGDFIESPGKRYFNFLLCHFQGWLLLLTQYGYQSCSHHICIPGSRTEEVQRKAISSWILLSSCIQCPYFYIIGPKLVTWSCISLNGGQYAQLKVRIVITKEIGENGFTEINNTYFHVVILFVCGGGCIAGWFSKGHRYENGSGWDSLFSILTEGSALPLPSPFS